MTDRERDLEQAARRLLDEAAHNLDARTLSRLRHGRAEAWRLAHRGARARPQWQILAGGAALAGVVIAVAASLWLALSPRPPALVAVDDVDLLVAQEGPDFYTDLDFYRWVAAHEAG